MHFHDKIVLITGGSSGIGLATAKQFAAAGARVWLVARDRARLAAALAEIVAVRPDKPRQDPAGPRHGMFSADLADPAQAAAAVAHVSAAAGVPDIVVNSAGIVYPGEFQALDLAQFRSQMEVNYFGTVYVTKAVVPAMIERRSGWLVNICSAAGFLGVYGYTAYCGSKYAVRGFSDALRAELKPRGVGMSVVFPPDTDTPQLAYENQFKPPETRALGQGVVLSAETVARAILRGVARGQYIITPGLETTLAYRLSGALGPWQYPIMDFLIARAQRAIPHERRPNP